ncbi:MAG: amino acid permease [Polyangiaceae bacterium]
MDRDASELARFGYAQELLRRLGGFSTFAIGFSVISVLTGITSTFGDALGAGGPAGLGIGWPLVSVGTLLVAVAMAELASAFPTAGALYHWSALLGGPAWGWATAMLNLVGQMAIVAAIDLACAQAMAQMLGVSPLVAYALFAGILFVHGVLNATSVRLVAWLNDASATVHIIGVVALAGLLFAHAAHGPAYLVATAPTTRADGSYALGFLQALVLGVWTFTGFDAAAHVSEETHDPRRRAPFGIVSAVAVSAVAGFALVAALTLAVKDLPDVAGKPDAALLVLSGALGAGWGRFALGLAVVAMWFAGLSSVTSASRMLFAFARDDGLPMAKALRKVSPGTRTPLTAIAACVVLPAGLVAVTAPLSDAVFLAVAALATVALYASYAVPIGLGAAARLGKRWTRMGPFSLGRAGPAIAVASVAWTAVVFGVCTLANPLGMGLFAGIVVLLGAMWALGVRRRFEGPKVKLGDFEGSE